MADTPKISDEKVEAIKDLMANAIESYDAKAAELAEKQKQAAQAYEGKAWGSVSNASGDTPIKWFDAAVAAHDKEIEDKIFAAPEMWWGNGDVIQAASAGTVQAYKKLMENPNEGVYSKAAAAIAKELNYAQENWPLFKELEQDILKILQKDSQISLKDAYENAYIKHYAKVAKPGAVIKGKPFEMPLIYKPVNSEGNSISIQPSDGSVGMDLSKLKTAADAIKKAGLETKVAFAKSKIISSKPTPIQHVAESKPVTPMWTLAEATDVVKVLQSQAKLLGYHVCLGGGTINNGSSDKDVDLYFLPMGGGQKSDPAKLLVKLSEIFENKPTIIGKDLKYPATQVPYVAKVTYWWRVVPKGPIPAQLGQCSCASCQEDYKKKQQKEAVKKRLDVFVMGDKPFDVAQCVEEQCFELIELELKQDNIVHEGKKK